MKKLISTLLLISMTAVPFTGVAYASENKTLPQLEAKLFAELGILGDLETDKEKYITCEEYAKTLAGLLGREFSETDTTFFVHH